MDGECVGRDIATSAIFQPMQETNNQITSIETQDVCSCINGKCQFSNDFCHSCNQGFSLTSNQTCQVNICSCRNGVPEIYKGCESPKLEICHSCAVGYKLKKDRKCHQELTSLRDLGSLVETSNNEIDEPEDWVVKLWTQSSSQDDLSTANTQKRTSDPSTEAGTDAEGSEVLDEVLSHQKRFHLVGLLGLLLLCPCTSLVFLVCRKRRRNK